MATAVILLDSKTHDPDLYAADELNQISATQSWFTDLHRGLGSQRSVSEEPGHRLGPQQG